MLAFKSTSLTRWLLNPPFPEAVALRESLQGGRYIIEWDGHETTATEATKAAVSVLAAQKTDDIVRKKFKPRIHINSVNNPHDWWFYACKSCWRKTVPTGNIRKCPECGGTEDEQRYKLSVNAKNIQTSDESNEVTGDFVFFGKHGTVLAGKEAALLAAQAKGRPDFVPPAIANVVGKNMLSPPRSNKIHTTLALAT